MKKKICLIAALSLLLLGLVGCGSKATCDFCGEEKKCTTQEVWGEELHICGECLDELGTVLN